MYSCAARSPCCCFHSQQRCGGTSTPPYPRVRALFRISRGSLAELETQMLIAQRQKYFSEGSIKPVLVLIDEVGRMLSGLLNAMNNQLPSVFDWPLATRN